MKNKIMIGGKKFKTSGHTYIMGILDVTSDFLLKGSAFASADDIRRRAEQMINDGADIIDVVVSRLYPAELYREETARQEEMAVEIIEAIKREFDIPVSIDTYKADLAAYAIDSGADMVCDEFGLKYDEQAAASGEDGSAQTGAGTASPFYPKLARVIAFSDIPCCLRHNRPEPEYDDIESDILWDLNETLSIADSAGIDRDKIIMDPGIDLGKAYDENLNIIKNLDFLEELGVPIMLSADGKPVISNTLQLPIDECLGGVLATTALAVMHGAMMVRVSDVKQNHAFISMLEAIMEA